jgi:23S rRNA pseudoU1915 N3-methylase RlmH
MKRIIEKKQAEMKQYMGEVKSLLAQYLPPDPQKMQQSKQAGNLSINPVANSVNLIFKNYVQSGDQLTLTFDTAAKKVSSVNINTFMGDAQDAVTLQVQMAGLPDGTNYAQQTILNATAKNLLVVTTNSNYQILGGS